MNFSICIRVFVMIFCAGVLASSPGHAEKRYALVIGNSAYQSAGVLPNATNDAQLMATAFRAMGFETDVLVDVTEQQFGTAIDAIVDKYDDTDVVAFYFAGHGLQKDGKNYLVPVDSALKSESSIERETISLDTIIQIIKPIPISLVFLDACRNNPWADRMIQRSLSGSRSASVKRGFAVVQAEGDMLITYATLPNSVASDGSGQNSPFARSLARHMRTPNTEVSVLMKRVTSDVMDETLGEQRPQQLSQMKKEFYFRETGGGQTQTDDLRALLTVYPAKVSVGQEVSVVADVPSACTPMFVNVTPDNKLIPIPRKFFRQVAMDSGQMRYEISPGSRYGLVVQDSDAKGIHQLGFLCEPPGMTAKEDIRNVLKSVVSKISAGQAQGMLDTPGFGQIEYGFKDFEIQ